MSGDSSGTLALTDEVKLDGRMQLLPLQGQPNEPNESGSHLGSKWCKCCLESKNFNQAIEKKKS